MWIVDIQLLFQAQPVKFHLFTVSNVQFKNYVRAVLNHGAKPLFFYSHSLRCLMYPPMRSSPRPLERTSPFVSPSDQCLQCTTLAVHYWVEPRPTASPSLTALLSRTPEATLSTSKCLSRCPSALTRESRYYTNQTVLQYYSLLGFSNTYTCYRDNA